MTNKKYNLPSLQVDLQETPSNNKLFSQTIFPFSGANGALQSAVKNLECSLKQFAKFLYYKHSKFMF